MVTYFNKKDMVRFGNYLLSEERTEMILSHPDKSEESKQQSLKTVSDADINNFLEKIKKE